MEKRIPFSDENNPRLEGPRFEVGKYHVVVGRIGEGTEVDLDLFVDSAKPVATTEVPINPKENPSKMAIGQERERSSIQEKSLSMEISLVSGFTSGP